MTAKTPTPQDDPDAGLRVVTVRYRYGFNFGKTGEHEVLKVTQYDGGVYRTEVLLTHRNQIKVKAVAMILDAPEES